MSSSAGNVPDQQKTVSPYWMLLAIAAINIGGPFLPVPNAIVANLGGVVFTLVYVGAVVAFALGIARKQFSIPIALAWLGLCVAVWLGIEYGLWSYMRPYLGTIRDFGRRTPTQQLLVIYTTTIQDLAMVSGATFAGTILSRLIRHPNMIGPIGAAIALIDIWGVLFGGIVSQLMTNKVTQPIAQKVMSAGPKLGAVGAEKTGFSINIPSIGIGDFLFIALLLSVLVNLAMNWKTAARLMWILSVIALLAITFRLSVPWPAHLVPLTIKPYEIDALPGLLFIGLGAVLPNWKYFRFTREEAFALVYAGILVVVLTVGLYFGFKAALPAQH